MPSTWIAIILSVCTVCGGLAVVEFNGILATLVKVMYAVSTLSLAAYLALHGTDESPDGLEPVPGHTDVSKA
ncbi:MAG: hypothetical protein K0Q76_4105 [Panacagrimonas sp.]|jgi:hypothetical protein|nr:hypothetical protein [Panacagrimonas sp.]MCC2658997.1 hypothetical protein [Panacagrimonas sp.]